MSAAPAESMRPPLEGSVGRGHVRGCSHPASTCTVATGLCPDVYVRWWRILRGRAHCSSTYCSWTYCSWAQSDRLGLLIEGRSIMGSESACVQEKHRVKAQSSYRLPAGARNDGVHDVLGEPPAREVAGRLRGDTTARDDPLGPVTLAVERLERSVHGSRLDLRLPQVVSYERIPRAAFGERPCTAGGEAVVVDQPRSRQRGERLSTLTLDEPAALEVGVDLGGAPVSMAQPTERRLDRVARPAPVRRLSSRREPPLRPPPRPRRRPRLRPTRLRQAPARGVVARR